MHPAKRHQHEQEKQREAACPDAGKIEKHTEGDGKDEAPQSSDHPHSNANLADMVRVIDGDVLETLGLSQAPEKEEYGHRIKDESQPSFGSAADRHVCVLDYISRWRGGDSTSETDKQSQDN